MEAERLNEIRKRADAATKGPWDSFDGLAEEHDERGVTYWVDAICADFDNAAVAITTTDRDDEQQHDNATFIAHAREDIPALLTHIAALAEANRKMREACELAKVWFANHDYDPRECRELAALSAALKGGGE